MPSLNICLINDSFPPAIDGVANAVTNYGEFLNKNHGKATVVTPYYPDADDSGFGFPVVRYPSVDMTKLLGYRAGLPFSAETLKTLEDAKFDLIHSHCPITSTMLARSLRERMGIPLVMTYHTKFDIDIANAIQSKLLQKEAKALLVDNISACDEVWTVSHGAGENLRALGYQGDYIVMPNGVDFPQGRVSETQTREVTGGYDLPPDVPLFLYVGRMMWYKGIRIMLDALKRLRDGGQAFRMVFVGGGGDKQEIVDYTAALGLDGCVQFVEPQYDRSVIRAWYCRADLFLFPSTFDTNGLVVREAAACGLASVLIAGSCAAEDVRDGESGFFIEENADSMGRKLAELCRMPEKMKQVGICAQQTLYISWENSVARAAARYEIVIENYRSGRYAPRRLLSDELFHAMAGAMNSVNRNREQHLRLKQGLEAGASEIMESFSERGKQTRDRMEELVQHLDRFL